MPSMVILSGADIWHVEMPNHPLIEGVLWEGDVVMLLGSEKAGKSILGLQLAFCLSSGTPFLDKYPVVSPTPVMYIQTEGKESEMVERMRHMAEVIPVNETYFSRVFQHFLPLDEPGTIRPLIDAIRKMLVPPRVIIIDSLYTSMGGDLSENQAIRQFITCASELLTQLGVTLVIIHHETKEHWEGGVVIEKGDKASYGSVFLRAWVSHILYLKKRKDKSRTLTCDTQRSGKVMESEDLVLVEPVPLCFKTKDGLSPGDMKVYMALQAAGAAGLTRDSLVVHTSLSMPAIEKALQQLVEEGRVTKTSTRPVVYTVCSIAAEEAARA